MVVGILSSRIQWILYISMCPWLLKYVKSVVQENEWTDGSQTSHRQVGLYAGLPVGLFLSVAVIAVVWYICRLIKKMPSSTGTTSDQKKPTVFVQPCRTEKVSRDVFPTTSPISARRRYVYELVLPNVKLDASLVNLSSALYEDLSFVLRKDGAWRKLLQTEDKITRKMEMDASSYMEEYEYKPGKKALDILSEKGWTIQRLRDNLHQLGFIDCLDILEKALGAEETTHINNGFSTENLNAGPVSASSLSINDQQPVDSEGAEETTHINNGCSVESLNAGPVSASSLSINDQQPVDSEGLGTKTDSISSDQLFGEGNRERIESRSTTVNSDVQLVRPVSEPFDVDFDQEEETSGESLLPNFEMFMEEMEEEAEDYGQDRAGFIQFNVRQESGTGMCKLLLPKSSIPVTQASFVQPHFSDELLSM